MGPYIDLVGGFEKLVPEATGLKAALLDSNVTSTMKYSTKDGIILPSGSNSYPRIGSDISDSESVLYKDEGIRGYLNNLSQSDKFLNDPTYLGFSIWFDFDNSPLFKGALSQKLSRDNIPGTNKIKMENVNSNFPIDSALGYLERTNPSRLKYLQQFVKRLKFIQTYMPWYWQGIEGLGRAYIATQNFLEPFRGGDDAKITITTLESIDLTITGLIDIYRKACFDFTKTRQLIPTNLEKFEVYIRIKDIRNFRSSSNKKNSDILWKKNDNESLTLPYIQFKFAGCEFLPSEDGKQFDLITNQQNEMIVGSLTFVYKDVQIVSGDYPWLDFNPNESPEIEIEKEKIKSENSLKEKFNKVDDDYTSKIFNFKDYIKEMGNKAVSNIKKTIKDILPTMMSSMGAYVPGYLGNIYNWTGNPKGILNVIRNGPDSMIQTGVGYGLTEAGKVIGNALDRNIGKYRRDEASKRFDSGTSMENHTSIITKPSKTGNSVYDAWAIDTTKINELGSIEGGQIAEDIMTPNNTPNHENLDSNGKSNIFNKRKGGTLLSDKIENTESKTNVFERKSNNNVLNENLSNVLGPRLGDDMMTPNDTPKYNIITGTPNVYKFGNISTSIT